MGWITVNGQLVHTSAIQIDPVEMERIHEEYRVSLAGGVTAREEQFLVTRDKLEAALRSAYGAGRKDEDEFPYTVGPDPIVKGLLAGLDRALLDAAARGEPLT